MTPEEKWDRLNNPKELKDWGLALSYDELKTFPEGRSILLDIRLHQRRERQMSNLAIEMAQNIQKKRDEIAANILGKH